MARWGVIGGGVLGLMLAHRLSREGHDVTLIEGTPELGGLASAWQITIPGDGDRPDETITWDRHYHVTLLSDPRTQEMVKVAGLADQLQWVETKTGYYGTDGELRSVSNTLEFLQLPGLNPLDKLRLGGTIIYGSKDPRRQAHGTDPRRRVAPALVGTAHLRALLEAVAASQARRRLPGGIGGVHLGHDPAPLRRSPQRAQERDVRLRVGRLRPGVRASRRHPYRRGREAGARRAGAPHPA